MMMFYPYYYLRWIFWRYFTSQKILTIFGNMFFLHILKSCRYYKQFWKNPKNLDILYRLTVDCWVLITHYAQWSHTNIYLHITWNMNKSKCAVECMSCTQLTKFILYNIYIIYIYIYIINIIFLDFTKRLKNKYAHQIKYPICYNIILCYIII